MSSDILKNYTSNTATTAEVAAPPTGTDLDGGKRALDVTNHDPNLSLFGETLVGQRTQDISIVFNYNLSTYDVTVTDSGTATSTYDQHTLKLSSGTGVGETHTESLKSINYRPGSEAFGIFTAAFEGGGEAGVTQLIGLIDHDNGLAIGYDGTDFGVLRRKATSDTWVTGDSLNGEDISWLDQTKLNIYMIRYGWLGIAPLTYWVYYGPTRRWVLIHSTDLTNTQTLTHLSSPYLPMHADINRPSGTGADLILRSGSWRAGLVDGAGQDFHRHFNFNNSKSIAAATFTNIFTLRSKTTFQAVTNKVLAELEIISMASDGAKSVRFNVIKGATLGGTPSYADINTNNSVMEVDTAGTTVTGGTDLFVNYLSKVDSNTIDLLPYDYLIYPGETLTFAAYSVNANDVAVSVNWGEVF